MATDANIPTTSIVSFLGDPTNYPHRPPSVEIVQTHASVVALAGDFVYKVKKPVDFGFLDFTTLEKRKHYCEEEVRLNRRMCPSIYEGVVPICREREGDLAFGAPDDSAVVEYAVRMQRLPSGRFMDELVRGNALTHADLSRVCEKLATFYRNNPATKTTSEWGRIDRIRISVDENFDQIRQQEGSLLSHAAIRAFEVQADHFFAANEELLERRRRSGMVRDCHGDLHLDHVHITDDRICIYDCIEFSERFRSIDIANDIAFLAMDLDFNGRPDLSTSFELQMAELLGDTELALLLPFYKTYRAIVRGKVAGLKAMDREVPDAARDEAGEVAREYYRLALQYAVTNDKPMVAVVMGRVGTGKSTQARMLGEALGWKVFSSDAIRKQQAGLPLHARGSEDDRRRLYSSERTLATYESLLECAISEVRAHRGVVLDATFSRRADRDRLRLGLAEVPHRFCEIVAPDDVIRDRLTERDEAENMVSDARLEDFEMLSSRYEVPDPHDPIDGADFLRITSAATPAATQRLLLVALVGRAGG